MAAATFENSSAAMVKTKKTLQSETLCQAWNRTKRSLRNAGRNKIAIGGIKGRYAAAASPRCAAESGVMGHLQSGHSAASEEMPLPQDGHGSRSSA